MKNLLIFVSICSLTILTQRIVAQNRAKDLKPVTNTYAITHANLIPSPGLMEKDMTILVKDGIILKVGKNISVPGEAEIIDADSMFVYAGFIAGLSHAGIPSPTSSSGSDEERPRVQNPADPPNELAGIEPEKQARDLLSVEEKSIEDMRSAGFTAGQVVPKGRMFPGSGAVILMGEGDNDALILKDGSGLFSQFVGGMGVYPSNYLGMMAKWRDMFRKSKLAYAHETAYNENPVGMKRPEQDRTLQALYPVINRTQPVFFKTEKILDAHRAMTLQKELGFDLVLVELKQGWDLVDKVSAGNIQVLLSLDLPKEVKIDEKEEDKEKLALEKKKLEAWQKYVSQAGEFEKANIPFGFSLLEAKPKDAMKQLQIMVKHGLSEKTALAALTTHPAQILGIHATTGTVEEGKIANLVITDQPLFQEKTVIKYVFVDGKKYEMEGKSAAKSTTDAETLKKVTGTWNFVTRSQMGERTGILVVKNEGGSLSGTITRDSFQGGQVTSDLDEIAFDGKKLSFSYTVEAQGQSFDISAEAEVEDTRFSGTMSFGNYGSFPIEGEKESSPERP